MFDYLRGMPSRIFGAPSNAGDGETSEGKGGSRKKAGRPAAPVPIDASYEQKFSALNQAMRWEVADKLGDAHLGKVNALSQAVEPKAGFYVTHGKRVLDVVVASTVLAATAPVNLALGVIVLLDLGWPIIFTQKRLGRNGKLFTMVKLKTMREAFDEQGRPILGERRVTTLGKLIRRSSMDELLNFWNVLKGDMSAIGPRPLVPEYLDRFSDRHRKRLLVRPGIECPLPRSVGEITYLEQFEHDIWYVENVSLVTDLQLLVRVMYSVFDRRQSSLRASSARGTFSGYTEEGDIITTENLPLWAIEEVLARHDRLITSGEEESL